MDEQAAHLAAIDIVWMKETDKAETKVGFLKNLRSIMGLGWFFSILIKKMKNNIIRAKQIILFEEDHPHSLPFSKTKTKLESETAKVDAPKKSKSPFSLPLSFGKNNNTKNLMKNKTN